MSRFAIHQHSDSWNRWLSTHNLRTEQAHPL